MQPAIQSVGALHSRIVAPRRLRVLSRHAAELLPPCATLLDVGCGDGALALLIQAQRPELQIKGLDVLLPKEALIPIELFDGKRLPFPDGSWDVISFIDVLHHTADPTILLAEARRVARLGILIKDHIQESAWDRRVLSFMDWVGNRPRGVSLPYNYWSAAQWQAAWSSLGLAVAQERRALGLYPFWASPFFETGLHFMAFLTGRKS